MNDDNRPTTYWISTPLRFDNFWHRLWLEEAAAIEKDAWEAIVPRGAIIEQNKNVIRVKF